MRAEAQKFTHPPPLLLQLRLQALLCLERALQRSLYARQLRCPTMEEGADGVFGEAHG